MHCAEYRDLVAAHVDGLLTPEEAALAVAHIADCERCARLWEAGQTFRQAFRARQWVRETPAEVQQRLLAAVAAEDAVARFHGRKTASWWSRPFVRVAFVGALAVAVLAVATLLRGRRAEVPDMFAAIVDHFHEVQREQVQLAIRTEEPYALRQYYRQTGAFEFTNTVVDLEPLGYILVGGTIVDLGTRKSTMTVYRGPHGLLLCHRIFAPGMQPPPGGEAAGGDVFYTVDGITICMHREGDVVCFMASALPRAEFIRQLTGKA